MPSFDARGGLWRAEEVARRILRWMKCCKASADKISVGGSDMANQTCPNVEQ